MLRLISSFFYLLLFVSFSKDASLAGRWFACGTFRIGDPRIELGKRSLIPCTAQGNTWTELMLNATDSERSAICHSSCGNIPPGTPCLAASGTCSYFKWSYDASTSTLAITDSTTVYYLVSIITDSSMVLIKK